MGRKGENKLILAEKSSDAMDNKEENRLVEKSDAVGSKEENNVILANKERDAVGSEQENKLIPAKGSDDVGSAEESNLIYAKERDTVVGHLIPNSEVKWAQAQIARNSDLFTCKWIIRNMPTCARLLEDGTLSLAVVCDKIIDKRKRDACCIPNDPNSMERVVTESLANLALPERFASNAGVHPTKQMEQVVDFINILLQRVYALADASGRGSKGPRSHMEWMPLVTQGLDSTCELMADQLDILYFRGKKGKFLQKCPVYKKGERIVSSLFGEKYRNPRHTKYHRHSDTVFEFNENWHKMVFALDLVGKKIYRAHKTCWQCHLTRATVNHCSSCNVALYCGRKCQLAGWKGGHKGACAGIKKCYLQMQAGLATVNAKHEAELLQPAVAMDFAALHNCFGPENVWKGTEFDQGLSVKSIEFYFDNLRRVKAGEFWFYSNTESPEAYKHRTACGDESTILRAIVDLLCYDYHGYLEQQGLSMAAFASTFTGRGIVQQEEFQLPVSRFLALYERSRFKGDEKELTSLRKQSSDECLKLLIKQSWTVSGLHAAQKIPPC